MKQLSLREAQYVAHALVDRLMDSDEPMPPFTTRYPGKLESCLAQPFQTVFGKPAYFRFTKRAAVLFYGVIKSHPFINGNKRMAVALTLTFFYINGHWLEIPPSDLYEIACEVAKSKSHERSAMIEVLNKVFSKYKTSA